MTSGQNFQPESLSELARFVQYMFAGIEKQLTGLESKLDQMDVVTRTEHREDVDELRVEIKDVKQELETYQVRLANQTRWYIGSFLLPTAGLLITIYSLMNGA